MAASKSSILGKPVPQIILPPPPRLAPESVLFPLRIQEGLLEPEQLPLPSDPFLTHSQLRMMYAFETFGRVGLADAIVRIAGQIARNDGNLGG